MKRREIEDIESYGDDLLVQECRYNIFWRLASFVMLIKIIIFHPSLLTGSTLFKLFCLKLVLC